MKKILTLCFLCIFVLIKPIPALSQDMKMSQAKVIAANYQKGILKMEIEIENVRYNGHFVKELQHDDYLNLHHHSFTWITIIYYMDNQSNVWIYGWTSDTKINISSFYFCEYHG